MSRPSSVSWCGSSASARLTWSTFSVSRRARATRRRSPFQKASVTAVGAPRGERQKHACSTASTAAVQLAAGSVLQCLEVVEVEVDGDVAEERLDQLRLLQELDSKQRRELGHSRGERLLRPLPAWDTQLKAWLLVLRVRFPDPHPLPTVCADGPR
jgi:hypothetical protein